MKRKSIDFQKPYSRKRIFRSKTMNPLQLPLHMRVDACGALKSEREEDKTFRIAITQRHLSGFFVMMRSWCPHAVARVRGFGQSHWPTDTMVLVNSHAHTKNHQNPSGHRESAGGGPRHGKHFYFLLPFNAYSSLGDTTSCKYQNPPLINYVLKILTKLSILVGEKY